MSDVVYVSKVKIERHKGPLRTAYLPVNQTVKFGVHGGIAKHYGVSPTAFEPQTTTIDYVIAATGG